MGFDFNKIDEYVEILRKLGAETLVFEDYQVGITEHLYYLDEPLYGKSGEFKKWENLVECGNLESFKKLVTDYFLGN